MNGRTLKIVVHIPLDSVDAVLQAMGDAGAGRVGNYTHCSFSSKGIGRFLPGEDARPTIGTVGRIERIEEERVEMTCSEDLIKDVVAALKKAHPYEEPTYDVYERVDI